MPSGTRTDAGAPAGATSVGRSRVARRAALAGLAFVATAAALGQPSGQHSEPAESRRPSFAAIATGDDHSCALSTDGVAYCWGRGPALGAGPDIAQSASPVRVAGDHRFASISAGGDNTCALDTEGRAWCWGDNYFGQIGDTTIFDRDVPTPVTTALRFASISVGQSATVCAAAADGSAWCWGTNTLGLLGDGTRGVDRFVPTRVASGRRFVQISVGLSAACAVDASGDGYCWGSGAGGRLGNGNYRDELVPAPLAGGLKLARIEAGVTTPCALSRDGEVYCWGEVARDERDAMLVLRHVAQPVRAAIAGRTDALATGMGQLCTVSFAGETSCRTAPDGMDRTVPGPARGRLVAIGIGGLERNQRHACGIDADGGALCWSDGDTPAIASGDLELARARISRADR